MKTKWWNLGYVLAAVLLAVLFLTEPSKSVQTALSILFAVTLSVGFSHTLHQTRVKKDPDYKRTVQDERNIMIKNKVNALNASLLFFFIGIAAVVLLFLNYRRPALIVGMIIPLDLILLPIITRHYEQRY